jgi:uncharacterized phage protein gp47/JayE
MAVIYTKNRSEILSQMVNSLEKNAGITSTSPGSIARAFAEAVADQIGDLYSVLKYNIDQTMINTASGRNLDLIGELYSVPRKQITDTIASDRNLANVVFSIAKVYSKDLIISKGTTVYNDISNSSSFQFRYLLSGDVTIPAGSRKAFGQILPSSGNQAHTAAAGTLTRHDFITPPGVILSVQNVKDVYSEVNTENDEAYRRRIIRSVKLYSTGTAESIRLAALSIKGVRDVKIREGSFGMGSCDVIVVPEGPMLAGTLDSVVYRELLAYKPVGIKLNVRVAERVPVSVSANIILPIGNSSVSAVSIANQAAYFVKRYLNSLTVGDSVDASVIQSQILSSSDLIGEVIINLMTVNGVEIPKNNYQLQSERSYLVAGAVEIYPAIIGSTQY